MTVRLASPFPPLSSPLLPSSSLPQVYIVITVLASTVVLLASLCLAYIVRLSRSSPLPGPHTQACCPPLCWRYSEVRTTSCDTITTALQVHSSSGSPPTHHQCSVLQFIKCFTPYVFGIVFENEPKYCLFCFFLDILTKTKAIVLLFKTNKLN